MKEKATLVIKLSKKQINRAISNACELAGEDMHELREESWKKAIDSELNANINDCLRHFSDEHKKIIMSAIAFMVLKSIEPEDDCSDPENSEDLEVLANARNILSMAIDIIDKKMKDSV